MEDALARLSAIPSSMMFEKCILSKYAVDATAISRPNDEIQDISNAISGKEYDPKTSRAHAWMCFTNIRIRPADRDQRQMSFWRQADIRARTVATAITKPSSQVIILNISCFERVGSPFSETARGFRNT